MAWAQGAKQHVTIMHSILTIEWVQCVHGLITQDTIYVYALSSTLIKRADTLGVEFEAGPCMPPHGIGTWHFHLRSHYGDGCWFSQSDIAVQERLPIPVAFVSCGDRDRVLMRVRSDYLRWAQAAR